ncbi:polysaccharide deacetylase [Parafrankia colletiae]|uniref:Polysaccharide deacetylase n=1 Tax=Parafrankia colletiae TaxID=573497 RepID=A0A1S1QR24_9ACTN|nr:polysaccharide deacetylase [Parafrankia colletiae]
MTGGAQARPGGAVGGSSGLVAGGLVVTAAVLAHGLPSLMTLRRLRTAVAPRLAGVGRADHVALTFDDGPDPASTPQFLEVLDELAVRATFFVLGSMVRRSPGLAREVAAAGHELAVHGWDHRPMLLRGPMSSYDQLARTRDLVAETTGQVPAHVRPPHGVLSSGVLAAARRLDLTPVLWTAWGRDWTATATPQTVLATLAPDLRGGATVLLHDSDCTSAPGAWRSALGALPELAARCDDAGLVLGPLADHGLRPRRAQLRISPFAAGYVSG